MLFSINFDLRIATSHHQVHSNIEITMNLRSGKQTLSSDSIGVKRAKLTRVAKPKKLVECDICCRDRHIEQMLSIDGCSHRYCFDCMEKHVEAKLLQGMGLPKCPHEGCDLDLQVDSCQKFLKPKLFDLMNERLKEATIPVSLKVYCPYPRCSTLMSKSEVKRWASTKEGAKMCLKCKGLFCLRCRVAWHSSMTCYSFKKSNPPPFEEEANVKAIAAKNSWRQCSMCKHMVSLSKGCYHITCRCGHQFCYLCGARYKDIGKTCACPSWDEHNLLYN